MVKVNDLRLTPRLTHTLTELQTRALIKRFHQLKIYSTCMQAMETALMHQLLLNHEKWNIPKEEIADIIFDCKEQFMLHYANEKLYETDTKKEKEV